MDNRNKPPKLFGTPLSTVLKDASANEVIGPINRRRQRLEQNQIVQDDQGRRRFHGAFTGGFSAGYYNTVDSVEGFKPRSFTSRRGARAQDDGPSFQHKPEDYMDEEDFGEFGIAPKKVRLTGQFSDVVGLRDSTSKLVLPLVVDDSIGEKIFRHMTRNRTASGLKHHDIQTFTPKIDYHGLGYKPLVSKHSAIGDGSTQSPLQASLKSGIRLKISGEAFGVGVLDDDEDNLHNINEYGHDDLANYEFRHQKSSRMNHDHRRLSEPEVSSVQPHPGECHLLPGFELFKDLSAMELCDRECLEYPLPTIEEGWQMPVRMAPIMKPSEESDLNRKNIDLYTSRIVSFNDKFTRSESSETKRTSDIEGRSGLVLYSDLKTLAEPVIHEQRPTLTDGSVGITISRRVVDWHPCSLLCNHFGVENPYPGKKFCGVRPSDLKGESAKPFDDRLESEQAIHQLELAPIEQRKSIFNVYFRDPDDSSDAENEPQVVGLDSDGSASSRLIDREVKEKLYDSDTDPEVVVMDVPKKEPEIIVLSSSESSRSALPSPASPSDTDEDVYGPPLPPSKQTLKGLHGYDVRSDKSDKRRRQKSKSHKKSHKIN